MAGNRHGEYSASYWGSSAPATFVSLSSASWVGFAFNVSAPVNIQGFRAYVPGGCSPRMAVVWENAGPAVRAAWFDYSGATSGWQQKWFRPWLLYNSSNDFRVAILMVGGYQRTANKFNSGSVLQNGILGIKGFQTTAADVLGATVTFNNNANGVDILCAPI